MNIWFSSGENPELSNLAKRPFTFEGKEYVSVEHAYQTLKGFNFDERVYKAYPKGAGVKIVGSNKPYTKGNWNLQLMETLIRESFIQNPRALRILQATGENVLTHYQDTGIWKKEFPRILMKVRDELKNLGVTTNYPQPQLSPISTAPIPAHPIPEPHKFINTPLSQAIPGVLGISDTPWK